MEPLSITLSVTALLKLTKDVVFMVKNIKDAPEERKKFIKETSSLCGMLNTLVEFINDCNPEDAWLQAVGDLTCHNGPLDQFSHALQQLKHRTNPENGLRKVGHILGWKVLKEDIVSLLSQVERLEMLVEIALDLDHFRLSRALKKTLENMQISISRMESESSDIKTGTAAIQDDTRARQVLDLLNRICSADYSQQHRDSFAKHHQGTGEWFLKDDKFQAWLNSSSGTLFCPGVPGAGKTIMAALVIEQFIRGVRSPKYPIVFIYCNYKRQNEQSSMHMASTFLRQISEALPEIPQAVHDLYQRTPTLDEVTRTVFELAAKLQGLTIVIDALDECDGTTRSDLLSLIQELQPKTKIRCLVTSRDFHARASVQLLRDQPRLEVKAYQDDLEKYIRSRLKYMRVEVQPDLQEELVRGVAVAADGMFLLALLLMDSFQERMKIKKIKEDLQNLPKGLDAYDVAYNDAMERISGQAQDPKECAERVLSLVLCAKRPVTILDVQHSLMVDPGDTELDVDNKLAIEDISSVCAGLVKIDKESDTVTFVHYTTQEYLQRNQNRWLPHAECDIARTCITYLLLNEFSSGPTDWFGRRMKKYPLATYAATYVDTNLDSVFSKSCVKDHDTLRTETIKWLQKPRTICSMMQNFGYEQRPSSERQESSIALPDYPHGYSGLHWAATRKKVEICRFAITQNLDLDIKDGKGMSLLARAICEGHGEICSLLLESGKVDVNSVSGTQATPLIHAVRYGDRNQLWGLLTAPDLNIDHRDRSGWTVLMEAVVEGRKYIFQDLLRDGRLTPDATDTRGRTALSHAAEYGRYAIIVMLLLSSGVNVDSRDILGRTPLSYAAECGHVRAAHLLLRTANAERDATDCSGRTPLSYATENGKYSMVAFLLLGSRATIDVKDSNGWTPLHYAAQRRDDELLAVLLASGADVNVRDEAGRTPLSYVSIGPLEQALTDYEQPTGSDKVIPGRCAKILCDNNETLIDALDLEGNTPLFYAVQCDDVETVRVLLETGSVDAAFIDSETLINESANMVARYRAGWDAAPVVPDWMFKDSDLMLDSPNFTSAQPDGTIRFKDHRYPNSMFIGLSDLPQNTEGYPMVVTANLNGVGLDGVGLLGNNTT